MKRLDEIFDIKNAPSLELVNCEQIENGVCFVSRTSANNGIAARVKQIDYLEPMPANAITVALSGSVLSSFYQEEPFYTAFHIACLYPKKELSKEQMLFYAYVIEQNKYRYNYGRQANKTLKNILVPDIDQLPDYVENISISDYALEKEPMINRKIELNPDNWKWFEIGEIFDVDTGKDLLYFALQEGKYPVIGHKATNNGITCTTKLLDDYPLYDNTKTISLADRGNFYATVQIEPFYIGTRVKALNAKFDSNIWRLLFICVLINKEQYRFSYGRNCCASTETLKIKLPVTKEDAPDWQFMENYIKSLPYSKSIL